MKSITDLSELKGLTEEEAQRRLRAEGYNVLPKAAKRGFLPSLSSILKEPMILLLVALGILYFAIGDHGEAVILLSFVLLISGITVYQERKTENALEKLRDLSSPRAMVLRDGELKRTPGREVARGDILLISEGDRIPADGILLSAEGLRVDESALTGESVPVTKIASSGETQVVPPGGDGTPYVFTGTIVVGGKGIAEAIRTGADTELGKIGGTLVEIEIEDTPLEKEMRKIVRVVALFAVALCIVSFLIYGLTRHEWPKGILVSLTLAMALIPEEFPVVLTVFLASGAWRISKSNVLTRRIPAVETLGAATVLCVDKTGTLTHNRLAVGKLVVGESAYDIGEHLKAPLPEEFHEIVEYSILASQKDPFDPVERAIKRLGDRKLFATEHLHYEWQLLKEYPITGDLFALSHVYRSPEGSKYIIAAKGSPEAISSLCHLPDEEYRKVMEKAAEMAKEGLRVIGVAKSQFAESDLPLDQHEFAFEFLGILGLVDPVRADAKEALRECHEAGIRVVMVTGDHPDTARHVAKEVGFKHWERIVTGSELESLCEHELEKCVKEIDVYARVSPRHKILIVEALKKTGEVVAMTGDGVNDAPALKSAHIGIAMGERGTDVAREAADLVLVDDNFVSIERAVKLGRRIFDNLKKAMSYIVAIHVPIAGLTLIPVIFKKPLILMPVHIAFLELVIDPACSIAFEAEREEADIMKRPPRKQGEPIFNRDTLLLSVLQGLWVLGMVMFVYLVGSAKGGVSSNRVMLESRTLAFTTLCIANLALILANRSWTKSISQTICERNRALWAVVAGTVFFLAMVLYVPGIQKIFKFTTLHAEDIGLCAAAGIAGVVWFELLKAIRRRRARVF